MTSHLTAQLGTSVGIHLSWFWGHPRSEFPFERNNVSKAYVPDSIQVPGYFSAGFFGGSKDTFLEICGHIKEGIIADLNLDPPFMAIWHDERQVYFQFD